MVSTYVFTICRYHTQYDLVRTTDKHVGAPSTRRRVHYVSGGSVRGWWEIVIKFPSNHHTKSNRKNNFINYIVHNSNKI